MKFVEPAQGKELEFALIPRKELHNSPYQRGLSPTLANRLADSMGGAFVIPLVVFKHGDGYAIADGQHRLAALEKHNINPTVPCIVVPPELGIRPLMYNVEKTDNIKDKIKKINALYNELAISSPDTTEQDLMPAVLFEPYLFIMAFTEGRIKSPSLIEPAIKKLAPSQYTCPLPESMGYRRAQADLAVHLEACIQTTAEEYNITDFNLKRAILSIASQQIWGRKRLIETPYEEGIDSLIRVIESRNWSSLGSF